MVLLVEPVSLHLLDFLGIGMHVFVHLFDFFLESFDVLLQIDSNFGLKIDLKHRE
jgi:hypothetical protein